MYERPNPIDAVPAAAQASDPRPRRRSRIRARTLTRIIETHAEHAARASGDDGARERAWSIARDTWRALREDGVVELFDGIVFGGFGLRGVRVSKSDRAGVFLVDGVAWRSIVRPSRWHRRRRRRGGG